MKVTYPYQVVGLPVPCSQWEEIGIMSCQFVAWRPRLRHLDVGCQEN